MRWLIYMLMIVVIPIIYCILLFRLRKRIPWGHIIIPILMGIFIFRTIKSLPLYILVPVVLDTSYESFKLCSLILMSFITIYIASIRYLNPNTLCWKPNVSNC